VDCQFVGNQAEDGGALYLSGLGPTFTRCRFEGNQSSARGGAAYVEGSYLGFASCRFLGNIAAGVGGAISCDVGLPEISECVFEANLGRDGGAIFCGRGSLVVRGSAFRENRAANGGGAILCGDLSSVDIDLCRFDSNVAEVAGGALALNSSRMTQIRSTVFLDDSAGHGGAISLYATSPAIRGCTIAGCAATAGSAIYQEGYGADIVQTLIAYGRGGGAIGAPGTSDSVRLNACDIFGNEGGDWIGGIEAQAGLYGNISKEPGFCDLAEGDLHLARSSPCGPDSTGGVLIGALSPACSK
jgi:predicted outer membrane repeat protein